MTKDDIITEDDDVMADPNTKWVKLIISAFVLLILSGCMPDANTAEPGNAGFWLGLWHGMIVFFSFIGSLFSDNIGMYEVANNGGWYDFGFLLGIGGVAGGASKSK